MTPLDPLPCSELFGCPPPPSLQFIVAVIAFAAFVALAISAWRRSRGG